MNKLFIVSACITLCLSNSVSAQDASSLQQKVSAAMKMDYRSKAEVARDANRDPVQALSFMGLRDDMKVIEFLPAGQAWYTKILGPVLADKGELYLLDNAQTFARWGDLLEHAAFKSTKAIEIQNSYSRAEGRYVLGKMNIGVDDADLFLNVREYHNFNEADKARLNRAAFDALKPGGKYVVIDHTRRHMQPESRQLGRREDPVQVILEVQAVGFELQKASDMFFREQDGLDLEVGHASVTGQTDRLFLVFSKP
jgi:predicted methyltransferase|tara:strand:- start:2887 stop:3648 length:762 start_codon:yes stop_codon:yes gene_type:complete